MGSPYGAYYLVPLLSSWYVFTYYFMISWPALSCDQRKLIPSHNALVVVKFIGAFIVLSALPQMKEVWLVFLGLSPVKSVFQSFDGNPYHLYNLFYYQRYMGMWGVMFGYITLITRHHYLTTISKYDKQIRIVGLFISVVILLAYGTFVVSCEEKEKCTSMQAYIALFPVMAYVFLRNGMGFVQSMSSRFLSEAGSLSLWLFVSQYHVLMANNGNGVLVLWPRLYYLNCVAVVVVYGFLFLVVNASVKTIQDWAFGSKSHTSVTGVSA